MQGWRKCGEKLITTTLKLELGRNGDVEPVKNKSWKVTFKIIEMATESYKERQEDELQVLQSIFMTDLKDMRENDAWKVYWLEVSYWNHLKNSNNKILYL